jgi:RhtB (resistance to homoserine/threonine) family protein
MVLSLLTAVLTLALLTVMPGPDVAIVTRMALAHGRAAAFKTALGIAAGLLVWGLLTAAGLAALLATSATAYTVVKWAGAAYLVWLGLQALRHSRRALPDQNVQTIQQPAKRPWLTGFVNNLLNPKIAVFYTSLLPQLVPANAPQSFTLLALVVVHAILSVAWLTIYAFILDRASVVLKRPAVRRTLDRITGVVLIGFGVRVAVESHR